MKKFYKNIIVLLLLLLAIFWGLDAIFTSVYKKGDYNKEQWLYNKNNESYDYGVLGSSRVYTTLDIKTLNEQTGKKGINLGLDGSLVSSQSLMLEILLSHGNTFKEIFFQIDPYNVNKDTISLFAQPRFLPFIKDELVFNHYRDFGVQWYVYRYVPYYRYAEFNFDWGPHNFLNHLAKVGKPDYDNAGGYFYSEYAFRGKKDRREYLFEMNAEYKYLNKVIDLCREHNIKLTLFTAPYASIDQTSKYTRNKEEFRELMKQKGVDYVDFGPLYNQRFDYFVDEDHLNLDGVEVFTKEFGRKFIDNEAIQP